MTGFGAHVLARARHAGLVVQPRMGFSTPTRMRAGLLATRRAGPGTVGTITLDSYTRIGDWAALETALAEGVPLNGYPIVSYDRQTTQAVLAGIRGADFPVQVRHGSADPRVIFAALAALGLDASEGGPVSYCLPYGRTPLAASVAAWAEGVARFADADDEAEPHLETFGGCMLGQLCPPGLLVALSVLEALFFCAHGVRSVSVSYGQQTNPAQDVEAIRALRRLCVELLPVPDWHIVMYAYMGLYPTTAEGARAVLAQAAESAVRAGAERLVVKTVAESWRIPTIEENVAALQHAATVAAGADRVPDGGGDSPTYREARALVEAVLNGPSDLGDALLWAFGRGYLDVPYCLHPDNRGRTRSYIDAEGWLRWSDLGALPLEPDVRGPGHRTVTAAELLADLSYMRRRFDRPASIVAG